MHKTQKLSDGNTIPVLGLGTWKSEPALVGQAVIYAIKEAGYRHIDCASIYGNEKEIGSAFKKIIGNSVPRQDLFITSKLWNSYHRPEDVEKACRKTLSDLKLEYLDLYLMHWGIAFSPDNDLEPLDEHGVVITDPVPIQDSWEAMENLVKKGLVKSIGVANFNTTLLIDLLTYAKVKPVMNQIELHPYNSQTDLIEFCSYKNIAVTAYSPLGRPGAKGAKAPKMVLIEEPLVKKIAAKYKKTEPQILLNWAVARQTIAIPKSVTPARIAENINIFDFELTKDEQNEMNSLNRNYRIVDPIKWWGIPYFL